MKISLKILGLVASLGAILGVGYGKSSAAVASDGSVQNFLREKGVLPQILTSANEQWSVYVYERTDNGSAYYIVKDGKVVGFRANAPVFVRAPLPSGFKIGTDETGLNLALEKDTAVKLAEIIFVRVYGEQVLSKRPWKVKDKGDTFEVCGTLPAGFRGGVPEITIRKSDAKVIRLAHGK